MYVTLVSNGDDWEGLYVDGTLAYEHHSVTAADVLDVLAERGVVTSYDRVEVTFDYTANRGNLTYNFHEIPLEVRS